MTDETSFLSARLRSCLRTAFRNYRDVFGPRDAETQRPDVSVARAAGLHFVGAATLGPGLLRRPATKYNPAASVPLRLCGFVAYEMCQRNCELLYLATLCRHRIACAPRRGADGDLLRGRIDLFSTDALIDILARLGVGVRSVVKPARSRKVA